ncbi:winged helix-turn-helix transcriptional regulator [Silvanigrella aquatica]|uniref:HTH hxlR-type domain-containing protein n=1 Tax=Silvanigrella aquatica TaxID=1915309 RepID=A0A1L4CYE5_9BACT|nr:helix-turn-helix domain-containing protein [Silvanigrella aquatica]APJ02972.1 hypothetical protein AXG55_03195 [Silvanigrella aquatica]
MVKMKRKENIEGCSVECTLNVLCGKWKGIIIFHLLKYGILRFSELQKLLKNIVTQRMLTMQLRDLEKEGIVSRHIYPTVPPKVEYFLTDKGKSLAVIIQGLNDWGSDYC